MLTRTKAFREGAAVLPRPEVRTLRLLGPDRERYLNGQISSDLSLLQPGLGQRAVKPSPRGRIEGLLRVRAYADRYELDLDQAVAERVAANLERFIIMDDCTLSDVSAERAVLAVYGPRALEVLAGVGLSAAEGLSNLAFLEKGPVTVIRDGGYGVDGFELFVPPDASGAWLDRLVAAGGILAEPEGLEILRIEAGVPRDAVDVDEEIIPMEAGLEEAVSLEKGCYVGQEVIARATNLGGVKHRLVGLQVEGEVVPQVGAEIWPLGADKSTGEVTSAVHSEAIGHPIALGYVRILYEAPGTQVELRFEGQRAGAVVRPRGDWQR